MVLSQVLDPVGLSSNIIGSGANAARAPEASGEGMRPLVASICPPIAKSSFRRSSVDSCAQAAPAARHDIIHPIAPYLIRPVMNAPLYLSVLAYPGARLSVASRPPLSVGRLFRFGSEPARVMAPASVVCSRSFLPEVASPSGLVRQFQGRHRVIGER